MNDRNPSLKIL